jgi:hypothetical protein
VVVTADHGVSFREGESARQLSGANATDVLSVPLLIKRPGQSVAERRDDPVQTVDILPTITEILDLPDAAWVDGRSLLSEEERTPDKLSCPEVEGMPAPDVPLPALFAAADAKMALFGTGSGSGRFPAVGPHPDLLDAEVADRSCSEVSDHWFVIENPELYERVEAASGFVPAEINGLIRGPSADRGVDLAVAVNGAVAATTRSYTSGASDVFPWTAIVPESAFREGANRVEVFAVKGDGRGCSLLPSRAADGDLKPSFLNVRLGAWPVPLVEEGGFAKSAIIKGETRREIRRKAWLEVPLAAEDSAAVRRLKVDLALLEKGSVNLRIIVDNKRLFDGEVSGRSFVRTFDLEPRAEPRSLTIRLRGASVEPSRRNVLAVRGIWLVAD